MKKFFTLISVALCAMSVNAQTTETMSVMDEAVNAKITAAIENPTDNSNPNFIAVPQEEKVFPEGTSEGDLSVVTGGSPISLKEYVWEHSTGTMSLKAVSTPNADAAANESWQLKGNGGTESLAIEGGVASFTQYYCPKNGNPAFAYKDFYEYNSDGDAVHRVKEQLWTPDCGQIPAKGCYYEFTPTADGSLTAGVWLNKNLAQKTLYIIDETAKLLPYGDIKLKGFRQNNTYEKNEADEAVGGFKDFALNENYLLNLETDTNRPFFGLVTFNVTAGKKYYMFSSNSQLGFFGYEFTPSGTGISNITATDDADAPVYNLAGQRVSKDTKGLLIKNGKKFINK